MSSIWHRRNLALHYPGRAGPETEMPLLGKSQDVWEDLSAYAFSNPKLSPSDTLLLGITSPEPPSETATALRSENK